MKRLFIFFVTCFFTNSLLFAQSDLPKPGIGAVISGFELGLNGSEILPFKTEDFTGRTTRIKVNPLLAISGDMPVYVEHEISEKLSIEIGAGVTYDNLFADLIEDSKYELEVVKEGKHGVSGSAALRFYPAEGGEKLERYYFSPEVRFRHYRGAITELGSYKTNLEQRRNVTDFKLLVGYLNYIGDNVFIDFYGGFGMRRKDYKNKLEDFAAIYDPATGITTVKPELYDKSENKMLFSLGFKLGFNF